MALRFSSLRLIIYRATQMTQTLTTVTTADASNTTAGPQKITLNLAISQELAKRHSAATVSLSTS
jgi:hypothetical protein